MRNTHAHTATHPPTFYRDLVVLTGQTWNHPLPDQDAESVERRARSKQNKLRTKCVLRSGTESRSGLWPEEWRTFGGRGRVYYERSSATSSRQCKDNELVAFIVAKLVSVEVKCQSKSDIVAKKWRKQLNWAGGQAARSLSLTQRRAMGDGWRAMGIKDDGWICDLQVK